MFRTEGAQHEEDAVDVFIWTFSYPVNANYYEYCSLGKRFNNNNMDSVCYQGGIERESLAN